MAKSKEKVEGDEALPTDEAQDQPTETQVTEEAPVEARVVAEVKKAPEITMATVVGIMKFVVAHLDPAAQKALKASYPEVWAE